MTTPERIAPSPDTGRLTVAHELLLLIGGAPAAARRDGALHRALAGGLLGELALRGLLRITAAGVQLSPIALDALPQLRLASPALALALEQLLATRDPYPPAEWIAILALRGQELRSALLRELEPSRVLASQADSPAARRTPLRQPLVLRETTARRLRERLRAVALHGVPPSDRERLQLSLLCACGWERAVLQPDERRRARPRLHELTCDEPIGEAVRRPRRPRPNADPQAPFPEERLPDLLAWLGLPAALVDRLAFFWRS